MTAYRFIFPEHGLELADDLRTVRIATDDGDHAFTLVLPDRAGATIREVEANLPQLLAASRRNLAGPRHRRERAVLLDIEIALAERLDHA